MTRRAPRVKEVADPPGRRLLLDTHTLLWWLTGDPHLSRAARRLIEQPSSMAFVSAASAWEITTKVRLGRLNDPQGVTDSLDEHLRIQGFRELPITLEHGRRAGMLAGPHKDPFDRMLIAQAQSEGLAVVSNGKAFDPYGVARVW
jgi:PIN domain nuclease of toxin-antitoxin system